MLEIAESKAEQQTKMAKCFSWTTTSSPPTSPGFEPRASPFSRQRRTLSAPFTGDKVRATICCFRCHRPRCLYSSKPLSSKEQTLLDYSIEQRVFTCGSSVVSPTNILVDRVFWKTCLTCNDAVETSFYSSCLCLENVCHHCGETEEHVSVGTEHSNSFRLILPVCKQCGMFGIRAKMLMPLSLPNSRRIDDDTSSLSSPSEQESQIVEKGQKN